MAASPGVAVVGVHVQYNVHHGDIRNTPMSPTLE